MLACNKNAQTYKKILSVLSEKEPNFKPKHITVDFEQAAIKAIREVFAETLIHGCFFHYGQNIWKHIQQVGLQSKYAEDPDFAMHFRLILALPFVPIEDVEAAFDEIISSDFFKENEESAFNTHIQTFLNYFESTYIGKFDRRGKRKPGMFPVELWDIFNLIIEGNRLSFTQIGSDIMKHSIHSGLPRTNNSVEGWHNALRLFIGHSHPNIFKFIDSIQAEQDLQEVRMAQISASQDPNPRKKKYIDLDQRLKKIVEQYDKTKKVEYLTKIAHNLVF